MRPPLNRFGVVAPFDFQPTRSGLRGGFGRLGAGQYSSPVGQGAGKGAETGASEGAAIGSAIPVVGTAIGTVVGAIAGAIAGSIGKVDPEIADLSSAVNLYHVNPQQLAQIANKYLVLAGWFDLEPNQVNVNGSNHPVWTQYGRMGEANFARDLANVVYAAAQNGQIGPSDTAASIYNNVVVPWVSSFGKGQEVDTVNPGFIPTLIQGLIIDYVTGYWRNAWRARSGDTPTQFSNVPMFALPGSAPSTPATTPVNPIGSTVTAPLTPTYSPSGSVITVSAPGSLATPVGNFSVQGTTFVVNGTATATSPTTAAIEYANGQVYRYDANGGTYVWNNGWQATGQAPAATSAISGAITAQAPTTGINPVGSATTTTAPTPAQLVATPPAAGSSVAYAPDLSQGGIPLGLPTGMVFDGLDQYNGSWVLSNTANGQQYVLWQGALQPYTSSMFAPAPTTSAATVTGSGTTGVSTSTPPLTTTPATTPTTVSQAGIGWGLGLAIAGTLFLASTQKKGHRRRTH